MSTPTIQTVISNSLEGSGFHFLGQKIQNEDAFQNVRSNGESTPNDQHVTTEYQILSAASLI